MEISPLSYPAASSFTTRRTTLPLRGKCGCGDPESGGNVSIRHPEFYPLPNHAPTDGLIAGNYQGSQSTFVTNNQEDFKATSLLATANQINGFYSQGKGSDFSTSIIPITFPAHSSYPTKIGGASGLHTFSPSIINQFRLASPGCIG